MSSAVIWLLTALLALLVAVGVLGALIAHLRRARGLAVTASIATLATVTVWVFVGGALYLPANDRRAAQICDTYGVSLTAEQFRALRYPDTKPGSPDTYGSVTVDVARRERTLTLTSDGNALHLIDDETGTPMPTRAR
ncbi:hypothetical protein AB1K56_14700 [Microbacterium sp. BWR-S6Y]|uniref:hypothetical protein n=1 Tax=Microbacterium sp. BWR-S6Y TaxID=3232073 RepID=UPI0035285988